jgi:uncharacterized protein YjbJ (UPF0337 family)
MSMNDVKLKGQWKQLAGKMKAKWGELTHDERRIAAGTSEYLEGKMQESYGIALDEAARQVREFDRKGINCQQ